MHRFNSSVLNYLKKNTPVVSHAFQWVQNKYNERQKRKVRESREARKEQNVKAAQTRANTVRNNIAQDRLGKINRILEKIKKGEKLTAAEQALYDSTQINEDGTLSENKEGTEAYMKKLSSPDEIKKMSEEDLAATSSNLMEMKAIKKQEVDVALTNFKETANLSELENNEKTKNEVPDILSSKSEKGKAFKERVETAVKNKNVGELSASIKELTVEKQKLQKKRKLLFQSYQDLPEHRKRQIVAYETNYRLGKYTISDYEHQIANITKTQQAIKDVMTKVNESVQLDKTSEAVNKELELRLDAKLSGTAEAGKDAVTPPSSEETAKNASAEAQDTSSQQSDTSESGEGTKDIAVDSKTTNPQNMTPPSASTIAKTAADKLKQHAQQLRASDGKSTEALSKAVTESSMIQAESQEKLVHALSEVVQNNQPRMFTQVIQPRSNDRPSFANSFQRG